MKNRLSGWTGFVGCLFLLVSSSWAQTWGTSPGSGDWNTGANWSPSTVPNSSSAIATFGSSSVSNISLMSANAQVDSVQFNSGAANYTITTNSFTLNLSGSGVINNSATSQTFANTNNGSLSFSNSASAGNAFITNTGTSSYLQFLGSSTAANSTITNNANLNILGTSTGGSASITNNGYLYIENSATAGAASITNNGYLDLFNSATLGTANVNNSSGGTIIFYGDSSTPTPTPGSTGGSATITTSGAVIFYDNTNPGSAVITVTGGLVSFNDHSTGGSAQFNLTNGTAGIDISNHIGAVTFASLQGSGVIHMGANSVGIGTGNQSTTFSGVFDDNIYSSSLTKLGTGTLTLTGSNTYDGGTNILAGTVIVDGTGRLGTGTVQNSANLGFINSATAGNLNYVNNLSGTMDFHNSSNAGSAILQNAGTLTFHDTSSAQGASIVNAGLMVFTDNSSTGSTSIYNTTGTLRLNLASDASSSSVNLGGGSQFDISGHTGSVTVQSVNGSGNIVLGANAFYEGANNQNTSVSGVISGTGGSLTKEGSGTLSLSGVNTYTGGTTVVGGILAVTSDSALGAASGNLSLNGTTLQTLAGVTSTRTVFVGIGGGGAIDTNGFNSSFAGTISGTGYLTKMGGGNLILSGTNTYAGGTSILGGTLIVANANGLGTGTVQLNAGSLAVTGQTAVTWSGDYVQSAGTNLSMGLGGTAAGQSDSVSISGLAHLNGSLTLSAYNSYVPQVGDSLALIYAGNGLVGQFSQWSAPAGVRWIPVYGAYAMGIVAIQPSFSALGSTTNQKAVGAALDSLYGNPQNDSLMLTLGTQNASTLRTDYDLISPEQLTAVFPTLYTAAQSRARAVESRLSGLVGMDAPRLSASQAALWGMDSPMYADRSPATTEHRIISDAYSYRDRTTSSQWGAFFDTSEDLATIGSDANAAGYQFTVTGMTAGVDYRISKDMAAGLLLGYDLGNTTSSSGGKLTLNAGHAGLYGGWGDSGLHAEALAEAGLPTLQSTRAAYGGTATGNANGFEFTGSLNGGYDFKMGALAMGFFAGGQYTSANLSAFTEQGSSLPLAYPSQTENDLMGDVGLKVGRVWKMGSMDLAPKLGVSFEHQFDGYQNDLTAALATGGSSFTVQGPAIGQDDVAVSAGVDLRFAQGFSAFVQYDGKFAAQNYDRQNFSGGVNVGF